MLINANYRHMSYANPSLESRIPDAPEHYHAKRTCKQIAYLLLVQRRRTWKTIVDCQVLGDVKDNFERNKTGCILCYCVEAKAEAR